MSLFPLSTATGQFRVFLPNSWPRRGLSHSKSFFLSWPHSFGSGGDKGPLMKVVKFLRSPEKKGKKNRLSPSLLLPRPHRPSPPSGLTPFFSLPFSPARSLPAALLLRPFQVLRIHQVSHSHVFPWTIRYFVRCFEEYFLKALVNPAPDSLGPPPFFPSDPSGRRLSSKKGGRKEASLQDYSKYRQVAQRNFSFCAP